MADRRRGLTGVGDAGGEVEEHIGQDLFLSRELATCAIGGKDSAVSAHLPAARCRGDMETTIGDASTLGCPCWGIDRRIEGELLDRISRVIA